jgi:hypothetical protein
MTRTASQRTRAKNVRNARPTRRTQAKKTIRLTANAANAGRMMKFSPPRAPTHPCVLDYGESLLNPFNLLLCPCVPMYPALASRKFTTFVRGVGSTNTSGVGGITGIPSGVQGVDAPPYAPIGCVTDSSYAGAGLPAVGDTGTTALYGNSDYTPAQVGTGVELRLVSMGVRIRGKTTKLNQGGTVFLLQEPDHNSLAGKTDPQMGAYDECAILDFENHDWLSCSYTPRFQADFNYHSNSSGVVDPQPFLGVLIKSCAPSQEFRYEIVAHYEAIGSSVRGKTPSHVFTEASQTVAAAISQAPPAKLALMGSDTQMGQARSITQKILNHKDAPDVGELIWKGVKAIGGSILSFL